MHQIFFTFKLLENLLLYLKDEGMDQKDQISNNHNKGLSPDEESRIRQAFEQKDWNEIKSHDSWAFQDYGGICGRF